MKLATFLARRYVAGDGWRDALKAIRSMNAHGIYVTCDMLGENVMKKGKAERARKSYIHLLEQIDYHQVHADISIKLTQLGMDIGQEFCRLNVEKILKKARSLGNFVWIDMESSAYTDRTLELYKFFMHKYPDQVGLCIQAYLRRSEDDVRDLLKLRPSIRIVKGAYKEKDQLAFEKKEDTDANFRHLADMLMESNPRKVMIATHDEKLINYVIQKLRTNGFNKKHLEFAMLYGIRRDLQSKLHKKGFRVRVYTPFGRRWLPYFLRRLRERKENFWFAFTSLFQK